MKQEETWIENLRTFANTQAAKNSWKIFVLKRAKIEYEKRRFYGSLDSPPLGSSVGTSKRKLSFP